MKKISNKFLAIICMLISALTFSLVQFYVKSTPELTVMQKVFIRNFFSLILAYIIVRKKHLSLIGARENQKYLWGRSIGGYLGVALFFYGTMYMNLADAAMINKLSPFVVTILAYIFLKEDITRTQISSLIIALIGTIMVIKPKFDSSIVPSICLVLSAFLSGIAFTSLRALGNKENTYTIVFHYSFISVILSVPFIFIGIDKLTIYTFIILISVGILAAIGQIALTYAYKFAPAAEVSVYDYSNIIFSSLLGYFFLSEVPDIYSIIGGCMIIFSSILVFIFGKSAKKFSQAKNSLDTFHQNKRKN